MAVGDVSPIANSVILSQVKREFLESARDVGEPGA
jgi:hypothetical protein